MNKKAYGFTIIELLVVIVVIAIIATVSIVAYTGLQSRAIGTALQADLRNASTQLGLDKASSGTFPLSLSAANEGRGLPKSDGTTYQYTTQAGGAGYCLTAISSQGGGAFFVSNDNGVRQGACSGHASGGGTGTVGPDSAAGDFVLVPGNSHYGTSDFYVAKYEARNVAGKAVSQAAGLPWVSISQTNALPVAQAACNGCHLITEPEWMTIAMNVVSVPENWSGGAVGSGYIFRGNSTSSAATDSTDSLAGANYRILKLTNGEEIWDFSGNVWEWTQGTITGGQPGPAGETGYSWKDWSNPNLQWNSFPVTSRPTGTIYSQTQGVGGVWGNTGDTTLRAFKRSGNWNHANRVGVYTVLLSNTPTTNASDTGFRVSK